MTAKKTAKKTANKTANKTAKPRRKKTKAEQTRKAIDVLGPERTARLGVKYTCYACEARFYDLNKPKPTCPKCGANQLERPKESAKPAPPPPPPPKRPPRPLAPVDDEDEDTTSSDVDDGIGLEIAGLDGDEEILDDSDELGDAGDIDSDDD